jgi:hypothetical protein
MRGTRYGLQSATLVLDAPSNHGKYESAGKLTREVACDAFVRVRAIDALAAA